MNGERRDYGKLPDDWWILLIIVILVILLAIMVHLSG